MASRKVKKKPVQKPVIRKQKKITKQKASPKPRTKKAVTQKPKAKPIKKKLLRAPRLKSFYTLREDSAILTALQNESNYDTKTAMAKELAKKFDRTVESVRDRIRRYLKDLSSKDKQMILKKAKQEPGSYISFVKDPKTGKKVLECISKLSSNLRQNKRVKTTGLFDWVKRNLKSDDLYFATDHGAQLMNCILCELEEMHGVSRSKIEKFVRGNEKDMNLEDVFRYFEL